MDRHNDETNAHQPLSNKTNNTTPNMQRSRRPSHLILSSPPSSHVDPNITTFSPSTRGAKTAPFRKPSLPQLAVQPATGTSLTFSTPSPRSSGPQTRTPPSHAGPQPSAGLSVCHRSSAASLSSFHPSPSSTQISPRSLQNETEGSNETIRGVALYASSIRASSDLDGTFDVDEREREPLNRYWNTMSPRCEPYGSVRFARSLERGDVRRGVRQREGMHGVWLAVQCAVFLMVFSALASLTIWHSGHNPGSVFCSWIWTAPQPMLLILTVLTFVLLLIHELRGLSTVMLLYLESAILMVVTVTCFFLVGKSFEQESLMVEAVVLGCVSGLWGWTVLGFVRAAFVWRVEMGMANEQYRA